MIDLHSHSKLCQNALTILIGNGLNEYFAKEELIKIICMKFYCEQNLSRADISTFDENWLIESKLFFINSQSIFKETKKYFGAFFFDEKDYLKVPEDTISVILEELKQINFRKDFDKSSLRENIFKNITLDNL